MALVELLAVCALLVVVIGASLSLLETAARSTPRDVEWTHAVGEGRVGVARLAHELRQADVVHGATPNVLDFSLTVGGTQRRVLVSCDLPDPAAPALRRCTRVVAAAGGGFPDPRTGEVVVSRVRNGTAEDPVFAYTPDPLAPRWIGIRVVVPSTGELTGDGRHEHEVVLSDGAYRRNGDLGG